MGVPFIWCSNNLVSALLTQLHLYQRLSGDQSYAELEAAMRDWLFGCNPWGTSMIVGLPADGDAPVDPHSAFSAAFHYKIDGGLVDGPVYASIFNRLRGIRIVNGDEYKDFQSDLVVYHDDYGDYSTNEPTMDGTASLTCYLAALENSTEKENFIYDQGAIIRADTAQKIIYLVFSGGDYNDGRQIIRETLKQKNIKAHFFFTGDFYRNPGNAKLIRQLKEDGHYLGAHSDKHLLYASWEKRDSTLVSKNDFIEDLKNNYKEMSRFGIAKSEAKLFLPPFEWYNENISKWSHELGLTLINFTPGTYSNADYSTPAMGKQYKSTEWIYDKILSFEKENKNGLNGFLLLLHIGTHPDRKDKFYNRLDSLINELQKRGYKFAVIKKDNS